MRLFSRVEYDGTAFHGWQKQPGGGTVQDELENAFKTILKKEITITGSGRTDAGVHARAQAFHCDIPDGLSLKVLGKSLNGVLPYEISVYDLKEANTSFHARFSAIEREYKYYMIFRKSPLLKNRALEITYNINRDKMISNAKMILGEHDFTPFCASGSSTENMVCEILKSNIEFKDDGAVFTISANRFIYKMVRSLIGTLIDISRGNIDHDMNYILKEKRRELVGSTAAPYGLVLSCVKYREGY